ncbi:amidohydrolase, partial [Leucobacter sp. M11]|uniref:amidohydrolase n=1 Tax=Leucobacter sp. M11 TaxID=2993565 RepID=UPI002D7E79FF
MATLFTGGDIIVSPQDSATGQGPAALLIRDGRIVAHDDEALSARGSAGVTEIDLAGGTLIPGVGDGHAHPVFGGLEAMGPAIREQSDLAGIIAEVGRWKQAHPDDAWILGASYDATFAPGGEFDARWLDEVTGDTPTVLRCWDYHTAWVNTAALNAAGITADTPDPEFGRIVRRADGSPLGTLQEAAANNFLTQVVPTRSLETRVAALEAATRMYAEQGTTWVQDAWVEPVDLEVYHEAARAGRLHTRVNLAFRADPASWQEQVESFRAARAQVEALGSDRLSARTVKFFIDGVIENHTAALIAPYADRPEESGLPNWTAEQLHAAALAFDEAGFQLHLHAIGDGANRTALNAIEHVNTQGAPRERRHVIAHVALLSPEDIERFAQLGVIANFEPYWAQCDAVMRDLTIPHIGHDREGYQYLIGSVLRSGARLSFGSDWPVTTPDWRIALGTAVTRTGEDGDPAGGWLPEERITAGQALAAYAGGNAYQAF